MQPAARHEVRPKKPIILTECLDDYALVENSGGR
jgi:hypothetical protein